MRCAAGRREPEQQRREAIDGGVVGTATLHGGTAHAKFGGDGIACRTCQILILRICHILIATVPSGALLPLVINLPDQIGGGLLGKIAAAPAPGSATHCDGMPLVGTIVLSRRPPPPAPPAGWQNVYYRRHFQSLTSKQNVTHG